MSSPQWKEFKRTPIRLKYWSYANAGYYFVTICTENKREYFGQITNGKQILNDLGKTAERCWNEVPKHFSFVELDEFVVMPNHVHGIVIIYQRKFIDKIRTAQDIALLL